MIELRKINRHFKNGNESNHILKDIDIHIDEGNLLLSWVRLVQVKVR